MASQTRRTFTRIETANEWTAIADFGDNAAYVRGSATNMVVDAARFDFAIIAQDDVPADAADLPAALDALIVAVEKNVAQDESVGIGAPVPILLPLGDIMYVKSDQPLTHVTVFATLEVA